MGLLTVGRRLLQPIVFQAGDSRKEMDKRWATGLSSRTMASWELHLVDLLQEGSQEKGIGVT